MWQAGRQATLRHSYQTAHTPLLLQVAQVLLPPFHILCSSGSAERLSARGELRVELHTRQAAGRRWGKQAAPVAGAAGSSCH